MILWKCSKLSLFLLNIINLVTKPCFWSEGEALWPRAPFACLLVPSCALFYVDHDIISKEGILENSKSGGCTSKLVITAVISKLIAPITLADESGDDESIYYTFKFYISMNQMWSFWMRGSILGPLTHVFLRWNPWGALEGVRNMNCIIERISRNTPSIITHILHTKQLGNAE